MAFKASGGEHPRRGGRQKRYQDEAGEPQNVRPEGKEESERRLRRLTEEAGRAQESVESWRPREQTTPRRSE